MFDHELTETERAFFAEGQALEQQARTDTFADLDHGYEKPTFWQRLFGKSDER
jgi:hypothetical protein